MCQSVHRHAHLQGTVAPVVDLHLSKVATDKIHHSRLKATFERGLPVQGKAEVRPCCCYVAEGYQGCNLKALNDIEDVTC